MAPGSFSSSKGTNYMDLMMNSQQESTLELLPSQHHHHPTAPMNQSNEDGPSYPNADLVIEVSPTTLLDGKRFTCPLCYKGFQREQNLTLHRRVHNLPFHLKANTPKGVVPRKVYLCPESTCLHHNRSHALGDFGGLKKHYLRKHSTNKKHKCDKCSKSYAVASDLRAHLRACVPKKYNCECGARFSSHPKFSHHQEICDAQLLEDAAKGIPNSDMRNNSLGSISYYNSTNPMSSTTLPSSYMGDNSSKSFSNINKNSLIGSTTSYMPISAMGSNNNNINNLFTDSTMSHLPTFNMGHGLVQRDPSNIFSVSSTQQNQFQENTGIGYYTNLMMNTEYNNMNPENTSFMGDGSLHYGSGKGSNLFSGTASEYFVNENILGSSSGTNITSNMIQSFTGSSSGENGGFSMGGEYYIPFGTPNFVTNNDIYGSNSANSSNSNMVQPYGSWFSSSGDGSIMPQKHNFLHGSEHLSMAENSGFDNIMNSLHNPVTGIINEDIHGSYYQQGNYYGYDDGNRHVAGNEVMNSETLGATTGAVAPYEEQYWNKEHGVWY